MTQTIASLHTEIDAATRRLEVIHAPRLHCAKGCSGCCLDGLSVFEVEAAPIRRVHAELLATGTAHAVGACAFLDEAGGCRIYAERPYVCRTQGLPLRWIEEGPDSPVELRDICGLNDDGPAVEAMDEADCWTLGPFEERLAQMQIDEPPSATPSRTLLRALFAAR